MKPPYAIGSVPSLSGHAIAYRWHSLPRVRRHRASKPQGSSERVLPWQVTMDQLTYASLSHTHYWYEVGMLKVPASSRVWFFLQVRVLPAACSWSAGKQIISPFVRAPENWARETGSAAPSRVSLLILRTKAENPPDFRYDIEERLIR